MGEDNQTSQSVKFFKLVDDPCFGQKHEEVKQCGNCWIKQACLIRYRNRK